MQSGLPLQISVLATEEESIYIHSECDTVKGNNRHTMGIRHVAEI